MNFEEGQCEYLMMYTAIGIMTGTYKYWKASINIRKNLNKNILSSSSAIVTILFFASIDSQTLKTTNTIMKMTKSKSVMQITRTIFSKAGDVSN